MILYHIDRLSLLNEGQFLIPDRPHPNDPKVLLSHYGYFILSISQQNYDRKDLYHTFNIEYLAEKVRRECFPSFPSRLCCLFASVSIDDALKWNQKFKREGPIRICEFDYQGNLFKFDAHLLDGMILNKQELISEKYVFTEYEREAEKQITAYWRGDLSEDPLIEVLVPFPVKISKCYMLNK